MERKEITIIEPRGFFDLLNACEGYLRAMVAIAGMAGLLEGEILGLRWSDIDFNNDSIRVMRNYLPGQGFSDLKTKDSRRNAPMIRILKDILLDYRESRGNPKPEELLFPNRVGNPIGRDKFYPLFKNALRAAGLPDIRFHDLRHFYASLAIAGGVNPRALMELMGHANIQTTLNLYSGLTE